MLVNIDRANDRKITNLDPRDDNKQIDNIKAKELIQNNESSI